jgi:hypothetical protein
MVFDNVIYKYNLKRPPPVFLPHPEEPLNPFTTASNIDINAVISRWLTDWEVPQAWWFHWRNAIDIQVYDVYPPFILAMGVKPDTPVFTWSADGQRRVAIKPGWVNPGVIAHEQAHNSYSLLSPEQKSAFSALHVYLKNTNPLIKQLYSLNAFGLTSDIEGHAEVYRYIGQQMPEELKQYYPTLF